VVFVLQASACKTNTTQNFLLLPSLPGPATSIADHAITTNSITPKLSNLQMCSVDTPLSTVIKPRPGRLPLVTTQHQHSDCHPLL